MMLFTSASPLYPACLAYTSETNILDKKQGRRMCSSGTHPRNHIQVTWPRPSTNLPWRHPWKAMCKLQAEGHRKSICMYKSYFSACFTSLTNRVTLAVAGNINITSGVHVHKRWKMTKEFTLVKLKQLWSIQRMLYITKQDLAHSSHWLDSWQSC